MSQSMDENQRCKGMRGRRQGVKVQFTITRQLTRVGLLCDQLKRPSSSNVTFNRSQEEEGIFLFNSV